MRVLPWTAVVAALAVVVSGCSPSSGTGRAAAPTTVAPAGTGAGATAVATYRAYVEAQAALAVTTTGTFVAAVEAGNVAAAKARYPTARTYFETIEPVAESFEALDENIDARANDEPAADFRGFHRIEEQLWAHGNTAGMGHDAGELLTDVKRLQAFVPTLKLTPAQIANGAVELLDDVAANKITGEEDRYSHTDLWDFAANLAGARAAFTALRPLLGPRAPLATTIDQRFAATTAALAAYRTPGGGFVLYTALSPTDTRALAATVEALADALAQIRPRVLGD